MRPKSAIREPGLTPKTEMRSAGTCPRPNLLIKLLFAVEGTEAHENQPHKGRGFTAYSPLRGL